MRVKDNFLSTLQLVGKILEKWLCLDCTRALPGMGNWMRLNWHRRDPYTSSTQCDDDGPLLICKRALRAEAATDNGAWMGGPAHPLCVVFIVRAVILFNVSICESARQFMPPLCTVRKMFHLFHCLCNESSLNSQWPKWLHLFTMLLSQLKKAP